MPSTTPEFISILLLATCFGNKVNISSVMVHGLYFPVTVDISKR